MKTTFGVDVALEDVSTDEEFPFIPRANLKAIVAEA
jgi:hypothetical protein